MKEACGVFGAYSPDGGDVAKQVYYGLFALQHRGQESCGIAACHAHTITLYKDMGLVHEVFDEKKLAGLPGDMAIGHVRYSTAGGTGFINAQPLLGSYLNGQLALAHNGNLSNAELLRGELQHSGVVFQTSTDSELIMHLLARAALHNPSIEQTLSEVMKTLRGSYSLVMLTQDRLIACRDPKGMRPLCIGMRGSQYIIASETCALDVVGAKPLREVEPGEIIVIDSCGLRSNRDNCGSGGRICVFEYLYFARPDSVINGMSVHEARKLTGKILSECYPVEADIVVGVPDSGTDAAIGYAQYSGIPFGTGLIVNRYVGRTFIQPTQAQRSSAVQVKLHVLKQAVAGKRVVLVDDSIVRGTTSARLVEMMKQAGATEVHMRISAPPFLHPCYFGTDVPDEENLIACKYTVEQIRQNIGADSLGFTPAERLKEILPPDVGFCDGCFTGNYPY